MERKILLCVAVFISMAFVAIKAQTYPYQYLYSVDDNGLKRENMSLASKGSVFYFTFTNNKSKCFLTDKNGVYNGRYGLESYQYVGRRNDILVYRECSTNVFSQGQGMLYFSTDLSRLNWDCTYDKVNGEHTVRVLKLYEEKDTTPSHLY